LEICAHSGEKLIITDPKEIIGLDLAGKKMIPWMLKVSRGGYIKKYIHPVVTDDDFRELMEAYHDNVKALRRIKNKIKAN